MSRSQYEYIARVLRTNYNVVAQSDGERAVVASVMEHLANEFESRSKLFNRAKFLTFCGHPLYRPKKEKKP